MGWNFIFNEASLYKLRKRVSEKLKIVLESYDLEIHQKQAKPAYYRLKTMEKKKELSNIWGHETARLEMGRLSQTSCSRIKGDNVVFTNDKENVCNGRSAGCVRKETKFSFRHDDDKRVKPTPPSARPEPSTSQDVTKSSENRKSWRSKSIWEIFSSAVPASSQRYLYESIL